MASAIASVDQIRKFIEETEAAGGAPWYSDRLAVAHMLVLVEEIDRLRARFIAAARTAVPALIDEVERLRALLREAEWPCWDEHSECTVCGAQPPRDRHKYGVDGGGHHPYCRLAEAIGSEEVRGEDE